MKNQTHSTNFRLEIPDRNESIPFTISVQRVNLPNIEIEAVDLPISPNQRGTLPDSTVRFEPLQLQMLLDEKMEAYATVYKWMLTIIDWRQMKPTAQKPGIVPKTILLHILDNSKKNIVCTFRFFEAWPSSLGGTDFSYTEDGNPAMVCQATFSYKSFKLLDGDGNAILPRTTTGNSTKSSGSVQMSLHPSLRQ
jgi:hypothetical protein